MTKKDLERMIKDLWQRFGPELVAECGGDEQVALAGFKDVAIDHLSDNIGPMFWSTPVFHDAMEIIEGLGK